jgi:tRNA threonylcarbamoyladenosine biosynthesis protein TsaB
LVKATAARTTPNPYQIDAQASLIEPLISNDPVLILAFDTSGMHGSIALLEGPQVLAERELSTDRRSAQTLAPEIVEILALKGIESRQIKLVATTTGPGSFTGLRVGVTTAKTFAYAVGAEVMGLSTLEAIAHGVSLPADADRSTEIQAVLDAQRKELFIGRFLREASSAAEPTGLPLLTRLSDDCIISAEEWLAALKPGIVVGGAGALRLIDRLPAGVIDDAVAREPRAAIVGRLAYRDFQAGLRDDLWKLAPVYLRPSYAEEKAKQGVQPPH